MGQLSDWAELWCRLFGYYSCYQLSTLEAFGLAGLACLAAIFGLMTFYNLIDKLTG
jgi:hypothetical protein